MRKFGYLSSSSTETTDTLYHEEAIISAIKNIQKYGALNQTGVMDTETIKVSGEFENKGFSCEMHKTFNDHFFSLC